MTDRNIDLSDDRRIELRVGIHLGESCSTQRIYGDGVNLAARIESRYPPGGVAVSSSVRDNVENRLDLTFEDIGEQALKNIDRPMRVFTFSSTPAAGSWPWRHPEKQERAGQAFDRGAALRQHERRSGTGIFL